MKIVTQVSYVLMNIENKEKNICNAPEPETEPEFDSNRTGNCRMECLMRTKK